MLAALVVLALVGARLRTVLLPVLAALFLSTALYPPAKWLRDRGWPRALAATAVVAGSLLLVVGVLAALAPRVGDEVADLDVNVEGGVERVTDWLVDGPFGLSEGRVATWRERAEEQLRDVGGGLVGGVFGGAFLLLEILAGILLTVVVLFFFVKDGDRLFAWGVRLFPERNRRSVEEVGAIAWETVGGYLRGVAFVAFVDAVLIGLALLVIGVPLVLPLALLTFVGGFFPFVGAIFAGFVATMVALFAEGFLPALLVVAATIAVQQVEGNVLQPYVVGRAVALHPLAVLLAVAVGGIVWGIPGAALAVPFVAVSARAASHLRSRPEQ